MGHRQRPNHGSKSKRRFYRRKHSDLKNRTRDLDQVQDDLKALAEGLAVEGGALPGDGKLTVDEDYAGGGKFYCPPCARHFIHSEALGLHVRGKDHKRQVKRVAEDKYTHEEAAAGAGVSATDKGLPSAK